MQETTMPHWLTKRANLTPNDMALEFVDGTHVSFLQLKNKSVKYAKQLSTEGVKQHTRVAILSTNQLEMIIAVHALSYLGAIAVMLNVRLTKEELSYQLEASNAYLLLTTESLRDEKKRSEEHTSELQSRFDLVCRLLLE